MLGVAYRLGVLDLPPPCSRPRSQRETEGGSHARNPEQSEGNRLQAVSNAMVRLHKEQFGRGPTNARSYFAGPDTLVCTLEDALLPAERTMVERGEHQRVRESRMFLQVVSQERIHRCRRGTRAPQGEGIRQRDRSAPGVVFEIFSFEPEDNRVDGSTPHSALMSGGAVTPWRCPATCRSDGARLRADGRLSPPAGAAASRSAVDRWRRATDEQAQSPVVRAFLATLGERAGVHRAEHGPTRAIDYGDDDLRVARRVEDDSVQLRATVGDLHELTGGDRLHPRKRLEVSP